MRILLPVIVVDCDDHRVAVLVRILIRRQLPLFHPEQKIFFSRYQPIDPLMNRPLGFGAENCT